MADGQWFVATLVIQCVLADDDGPYMCDEQIRLIHATDAESAYQRAIELGKGEETNYIGGTGETVNWKFVGLENLQELEEQIADGVEIRSRLFGHDSPEDLVRAKDRLSVFDVNSTPGNLILNEDVPLPDEE